MDKALFNLLNSSAPAATVVVRLLPGLVFFAEGIKKFMFPAEWGIGRFEKIGIIYPYLSAPFVGIVETVCGLLLIFGLFSRPAALLLLIDIPVAILTTKVPLALHKGFWPGESRGSGGSFDVHEYVVSPHRRCRGPIAGRLVGKKAKRIG